METQLWNASRIVENQGLARNAYSRGDGSVCMSMALSLAWAAQSDEPNTVNDEGITADEEMLVQVCDEQSGDFRGNSIPMFNDGVLDLDTSTASAWMEKAAVKREEEL